MFAVNVIDIRISGLQKIEDALDRGGLAGRQCVLRSICELKESPIHNWSMVGELITNFLL